MVYGLAFGPTRSAAASNNSSLGRPLSQGRIVTGSRSKVYLMLVRTSTRSTNLSSLLLYLAQVSRSNPRYSAYHVRAANGGQYSRDGTKFLHHLLYGDSRGVVANASLEGGFRKGPGLSTRVLVPNYLSRIGTVRTVTLKGVLTRRAHRLVYGMTIELRSLISPLMRLQRVFFVPRSLYDYMKQLGKVAKCFGGLLYPSLFVRSIASELYSNVRPSQDIYRCVSILVRNGN